MEDFFENGKATQSEMGSFDFKHYLSKLLANYVWIIISLLITLFCAYVYLRYATPKYQLTGYIIVGGQALEQGTTDILANAGLVSGSENTASIVSNEIFILRSHQLNGQVVDSLKLAIAVSKLGHLRDQPVLIDSMAVDINVHKGDPDYGSPKYILELQPQGYSIKDDGVNYKGAYGQKLIIHTDTVLIRKKPGKAILADTYSLQLNGRTNTIKNYLSRLTVEQAKNGGIGLLKISVVDELPVRASQYIEILIHSYNVSYLEYQNQAIKRALVFLRERLETVSAELSQQENALRDFKASNQIYDVSLTAQELLTNLQSLDTQKSQSDYQGQLLSLVESSIKNASGKEEIVASTSGLQDPVLSAQVEAYNTLVIRKQMILNSGTKDDPRLAPVNDQLADMRNNIRKNITNIRKQYNATERSVSKEENKYLSKFKGLPEKEKQYVELNRKFTIKETQYIYLLQKKEETELQLVSSNAERSRPVDDILSDGIVSPVKVTIYSFAALLGILIPSAIVFTKVITNQKIETRKEIEKGTTVPILGELSLSKTEEAIAITTNNRSALAEQLRAIRTNLSFMGANNKHKVFVVTSSVGGEGKSFVSLNLGNSLAISNRRVAVLELDLRKPILSKNLGVNNSVGISNYIINESLQPEDIIQPVKNCPNLYLLNSGPVPPNPGELIIHSRMAELINYLRENFDFVILDSPPVGLVADSLSLAKLADISLFVLRPNHSLRSAIQLINDLQRGKKFPRLSLVINGIQPDKGYGGYGNYGSKGYGYYSDDEVNKESKFKSITNTIFKRN
ncbi:GumC family protein [Pedobacter sp.]|uniref:GumC family protein n=1 Tax=Pedobacter sp. TaxID=1411316 RepID=UPI003D7FCCD7